MCGPYHTDILLWSEHQADRLWRVRRGGDRAPGARAPAAMG